MVPRVAVCVFASAVLLPLAATAASATTPAVASESTTRVGKLPDSLPVRRDSSATGASLAWSPALALGSAAAAAAGWWAWTRRGRRNGSRAFAGTRTPIVRLSSQALTPQVTVHAVQWQDEEYLLACTPQQVLLLSRRSATAAGEEA